MATQTSPTGRPPVTEREERKDVAFAHFGVLNTGAQSSTSTAVAVITNITLAVVICLIGAAAKKVHDNKVLLTKLTAPIEPMKKEVVKPKPPPIPKIPPPKLPDLVKIEPPKIVTPVKIDMPKPVTPVVKMATPIPVIQAAAPLKVAAPPAPKLISNLTQAAAVANNSPKAAAPLALGSQTNPMKMDSRSVSKINLGNAGAPGMPASNTGLGPKSLTNSLGSGAPNGSIGGTAHAAKSIAGLTTGVPGGQGKDPRSRTAVTIVQNTPPPPPPPPPAATRTASKAPAVTYKPPATCTDDAKKAHIEGTVDVRVIFLASGTVSVQGVARGLGHGLDEAAQAVARGIRFTPAASGDGRPIDFPTTLHINFSCGAL